MPLVIAGERSGVGKTTITLMLLAGLRDRNLRVQSYKVGPDYIDPMFHSYVTGLACRNLDPILTSPGYVKKCFTNHLVGVDCAVVEGVMGLFDGITGQKDRGLPWGSTAHVANLIDRPVVLVLDCSRMSGSVAAIAHGFATLNPHLKMAGLILNRIGSDRHLEIIKDALSSINLPILGVLPRENNIEIPDRHLGLVPTEEITEIDSLILRLADLAKACFNWELLVPLLEINGYKTSRQASPENNTPATKMRVLVARDRAFNFYYQDNLDLLEKYGAELVFWSPLTDTKFPENIQGMYFAGGFPEVFAQKLSENITARLAVKKAILAGIPTIAECGGLMYLCEQIVDFNGQNCSMVGVLPATAVMGKKLSLGYRKAVCIQDNFLVAKGEEIFGHEFHRSYLQTPIPAPLFKTYRIDSDEFMGQEGWNIPSNLHASYIHMHWGNTPHLVSHFLQQCQQWHNSFDRFRYTQNV